jgi:hypothetical protein
MPLASPVSSIVCANFPSWRSQRKMRLPRDNAKRDAVRLRAEHPLAGQVIVQRRDRCSRWISAAPLFVTRMASFSAPRIDTRGSIDGSIRQPSLFLKGGEGKMPAQGQDRRGSGGNVCGSIELIVHVYFFQRQTAVLSVYQVRQQHCRGEVCTHGWRAAEAEAALIKQSRGSRVHTAADPHKISGETAITPMPGAPLQRGQCPQRTRASQTEEQEPGPGRVAVAGSQPAYQSTHIGPVLAFCGRNLMCPITVVISGTWEERTLTRTGVLRCWRAVHLHHHRHGAGRTAATARLTILSETGQAYVDAPVVGWTLRNIPV